MEKIRHEIGAMCIKNAARKEVRHRRLQLQAINSLPRGQKTFLITSAFVLAFFFGVALVVFSLLLALLHLMLQQSESQFPHPPPL